MTSLKYTLSRRPKKLIVHKSNPGLNMYTIRDQNGYEEHSLFLMMFYIFSQDKKRRIEKIRQAFHHRTMYLLMKMHLISLVVAAKRHRAKNEFQITKYQRAGLAASPEGKKSQSFFCTFLHGWSGNSVVDCDWLRSRNLLHSICSLLAKLDKKP